MGYFVVEVRWEAFQEHGFNEVDDSPVVGEFEDAKQATQRHLTKHVAAEYTEINWLQGVPDKNGAVYYGNLPFATYRIRH